MGTDTRCRTGPTPTIIRTGKNKREGDFGLRFTNQVIPILPSEIMVQKLLVLSIRQRELCCTTVGLAHLPDHHRILRLEATKQGDAPDQNETNIFFHY